MRNITISVKDQTYRDIRAWCAARDTSISHLVQTFLGDLPHLSYSRRFPLPDSRTPAERLRASVDRRRGTPHPPESVEL